MTQARTGAFDFHVDPSHFNFIFSDAMYIHVSYNATVIDNELTIACKIEAPICLVTAIVLAGKWLKVNYELKRAAKLNAEMYINNSHVDETILGALVPHM